MLMVHELRSAVLVMRCLSNNSKYAIYYSMQFAPGCQSVLHHENVGSNFDLEAAEAL